MREKHDTEYATRKALERLIRDLNKDYDEETKQMKK